MGHLAHVKEEYQELVARLNAGPVGLPEPESAPARAGWQEILEIMYSPEDAALASRVAALARIAPGDAVFLSGGVARNEAMVAALAGALDRRVSVLPDPQLVGALGAALSAR